MSLLVYLVLLAGPFMGLCHLNHTVILELLLLGIVNKLPNLKVSSSMIKKGLSYVTLALPRGPGTFLSGA